MKEQLVNNIILAVIAIMLVWMAPQVLENTVNINPSDWLLYYPLRFISHIHFWGSFSLILLLLYRTWGK